MKRTRVLPVDLLLVAMVLAFVALASPVSASPCMALGEYYSYAHQCSLGRGAQGDWLTLFLLPTVLFGALVGLVALRRHVLRLGAATGRAARS